MRSREFKKTKFGDLTSISDKSEHRYAFEKKKWTTKKSILKQKKKNCDLTSISDKSEHSYTLAIKKVNNKKNDFETKKKRIVISIIYPTIWASFLWILTVQNIFEVEEYNADF